MITSAVPVDIAQEKIKGREKFAFTLMYMGNTPILGLMGSFLMIFYTDVVGLNAAAVATLFLISRIVDAFNDPLTGYVLDHMPRTRMGKFRYLMLIGTVLCCLNYLLLWFGPVWSTGSKLLIAYISYLLIGVTYDIMDITKQSMLPVITSNLKERSTLGTLGAFGTIFGGTIIGVIAPLILAAGGSSLEAYYKVIFLATGFVAVLSIAGVLGVKERVRQTQEEIKYSFKDYLKILTQRPVVITFVFALLFSMGIYGGGALSAYFFTYVMKNLAMLSTISLLSVVGLLPGLFLSAPISLKMGKKKTLIISILILVIVTLIRLFDPTSAVLVYISSLVFGFVSGLFTPILIVMGADNIDFVEYKMNYRTEAAVQSLMTLIAKTANGLGAAIPAYILGLTGYIPKATQQPASTITAIILCVTVYPAVLYIASALVLGFGYNLDKKLLQTVQTTLSERRAAKLSVQK
jgi:sugar (glycoside-pentoside-hexuronide) transporter